MELILTLTVLTTAFERTKEKFRGFRQTAKYFSNLSSFLLTDHLQDAGLKNTKMY